MNASNFQQVIQERKTDLFLLKNSNGMQVAITNYGARIVSLLVHDEKNNPVDVVVGFDSLEGYLATHEIYHGAIIGRYANRIKKGIFSLNDKTYKLAQNNGVNHLHGGEGGFHHVVWDVETHTEQSIQLAYTSADGEEGYPGTLHCKVQYTISDENELRIDYKAHSDKPTIINLTNHAYFNLNGQGNGTILHHEMQINADSFTPIDETLIPYGDVATVKNSPFDFTQLKKIGTDINLDDQQLIHGQGYDHNFVLNKKGDGLTLAAIAIGDKSGIVLKVFTSQPGLQFYTGNFMKGSNSIKYGKKDGYRTAFCLETQHFPDSPNHTNFPSTALYSDESFTSQTILKFNTPG